MGLARRSPSLYQACLPELEPKGVIDGRGECLFCAEVAFDPQQRGLCPGLSPDNDCTNSALDSM